MILLFYAINDDVIRKFIQPDVLSDYVIQKLNPAPDIWPDIRPDIWLDIWPDVWRDIWPDTVLYTVLYLRRTVSFLNDRLLKTRFCYLRGAVSLYIIG